MLLVANAPAVYSAPSAYVSSADTELDQRFRNVFGSDAIHSVLPDLDVAGVHYHLRHPCHATYIPVRGEFLVEGFSPMFIGQGGSVEAARKNWLEIVHASFQELLHKRPFEMSEKEHDIWSVLSSLIDVTIYRNQTPLVVRQYGRISQVRPLPQQIQWENGEREDISIDQVHTPDFVTYKAGQPFEAVVARDPLDYSLLWIKHIERRSEPHRFSAGEETELLASIGSSTQLSEADWI